MCKGSQDLDYRLSLLNSSDFFNEMENTAVPRPVTPGYSQYELMLREAFNSIHYGADPKKTLEDAAIRIDRELRRYR